MIEIGGMPILWHIMKEYAYYGHTEFIICAGYKQEYIKEWFANYFLHNSDVTFDYRNGKNEMTVHQTNMEPWKVTVVDTGYNTMTGGRIKRIQKYVGNEPFLMTYGDGVCDVEIDKLIEFHKSHGKLATLTAVKMAQDKGILDITKDQAVRAFREKNAADGAPINAGYMILEPLVFDMLEGGDTCVFEKTVLVKLAEMGELMSYVHTGFWQCMDNIREKSFLEKLLAEDKAPWKRWDRSVPDTLIMQNKQRWQLISQHLTMENIYEFYKGKRVFLTGHTGFKGSWMCKMLANAGAIVTGYSLEAPTEPSLFKIANIEGDVYSVIGDIRDMAALKKAFDEAQPEIVLHLAAQPIVRNSYKDPAYTYGTNVMGTVNILECVRQSNCVKSFLNVTTDKVYLNKEWNWGYRENEELDGYDPYSNSKSCSELVTHSYKRSFFTDKDGLPIIPISTARAGNVIGGGDFATDRIIPDSIRAAAKHEDIVVRNPYSTRPYQHVLEPLYAYLVIAMKQYDDSKYADYYNVGPDDVDCFQTGALVDLFVSKWGEGMKWVNKYDGGPHEANFLKLDCSKLKATFGWTPRWNIDEAMDKIVEWSKIWLAGGDVRACMDKQIAEFLNA